MNFAHFLIVSLKLFLPWRFFLFFFVHRLCLKLSSSDDSDEFAEGKSDKLGSESGSSVTFGTRLGGLLHGVGLTLGVTLSADESCNSYGGSLVP